MGGNYIMSQYIKVKFHSEDNGNCQQLFKTIDKQEGQHSYYARSHCLTWYTVSDPLGYSELDYPVSEDITFIICDDKGNELFQSSNSDKETFPFLQTVCKNEWKKYCIEHQQKDSSENNEANFLIHAIYGNQNDKLSRWLLTFKDPELYGASAKDYDENWTMFRIEELSRKRLHKFMYCGLKQEITEITMRHTICNVTWKEYYSGQEYCGSVFDTGYIGSMYSPTEAKKIVINTLKEIYGDRSYITQVTESYGAIYERHFKLTNAAEILLNGNYSRNFVDIVIQKENESPSFFSGEKEARETYKDKADKYIRSYNYPYF
jgi:hypothetical protein